MTATLKTPAPSTPAIPDSLDLVVTKIEETCPQIRTFTLAAPDGHPLPGFVPGSHIVVSAGEHANAYSLIGNGLAPTSYAISVLRLDEGRGGSRWMHELSEGDHLTVEIPRSAFAPQARAAKHLLIAGGIGVTPILSHLRAARQWSRPVQVLYTFREGRGAHVDEIVELAGSEAELFTDQDAFLKRLTATLAEQPIGTHLYVCGPAGMIDQVTETASTLGWPSSRVHFERFGIDALDAGDPFSLHMTSTGVRLDVPPGTSALEAMEAGGFSIPNRCRQGVCGECRTPVTGAGIVHRDLYLSQEEKHSGDSFMPCVSRADDGCTLEVPL